VLVFSLGRLVKQFQEDAQEEEFQEEFWQEGQEMSVFL